MMSQKEEVYRYYKCRYSGFIVLFQVGDHYEAYESDAHNIAGMTGWLVQTVLGDVDTLSFPCNNLPVIVEIISKQDLGLKIISCLNECGAHSLPNVRKIKDDMLSDY